MRFSLAIDLDNAGVDLPVILAGLTARVREGAESGAVTDIHGHTVGHFVTTVTAADRKHRAWEMREEGAELDEIAKALHVSVRQVSRYLKG